MLFYQKKIKQKIAYIISRIFDPVLWLSILSVFIIFSKYLDGYNKLFWSLGFLLFLGILPLFVIWLGLRKGKISDIDFTDRRERTPYLLSILFFWFLAIILTWALSGPPLIFILLINSIIIGSLVLIINFYWKISNHALMITAIGFLIVVLYGWQYSWFFLFIPVVAWSRLVQKKHTIAQLVGGVLLGCLFFYGLKFFGY